MDVLMKEFLKIAEEAARAGGRVLLQHRYEPLEIEHKDRREVVTNVDKLADAAICTMLSHYFPDHAIVSEESGARHTTSPYTWIIDPLDGTESYIRGQNFSGVTIALTKEGCTILGVVLHPFHDELYAVVLGEETTVNGHPVHVSDIAGLEQARLIIDYSPRDTLRQHLYTVEWERGIKQMFRIGGSVALNMCLVARGAAEGYLYGRVRNRVKSWDIAAAALLVQGAGGRVLDRHGQTLDTFEPQPFLLCCNASLDLPSLLNSDFPLTTSEETVPQAVPHLETR
jgi:myo-inositol-1(or 4)-monophosphatase